MFVEKLFDLFVFFFVLFCVKFGIKYKVIECSFLKHNYSFDVPNNCHWLGTAFDTSESFQCNKRQAFMLNNTDVVEYLFDTVYLAYGRLYSVQRGLRLKQIENEELLDDMQTFLTMYQTLSEYTLYKNKLLKPTTTNKK